jgi:hypothetical protein
MIDAFNVMVNTYLGLLKLFYQENGKVGQKRKKVHH